MRPVKRARIRLPLSTVSGYPRLCLTNSSSYRSDVYLCGMSSDAGWGPRLPANLDIVSRKPVSDPLDTNPDVNADQAEVDPPAALEAITGERDRLAAENAELQDRFL